MTNNANERRVILGMVLSTVLGLVKLFAGLIGHSYALVADAVESLTDILTAGIVLGGLRISTRPINERHPYGYGKAEALSGFVVAMIIFAAGIGIAIEAIHEIRTPHHAPAPFTLVVLIFVVLIKEGLYRYLHAAGKASASTAMSADAFHHRSDAITSALAFVGISVALVGGPGWEPADDYAALIASAIILWNAARLAITPIRELLDVQADDLAEKASTIALQIPEVRKVQKAFSRKSGSVYFIDMHIWVNPEMNIRDAHQLAHIVKDGIRRELSNVHDVLIHLEPDNA